MSVFRPKPPASDAPGVNPGQASAETAVPQSVDPRLQPTPDFGTLGPGSDIAQYSAAPGEAVPAPNKSRRELPANARAVRLIAVMAGVVAALVASNIKHSAGKKIAGHQNDTHISSASSAIVSQRDLDRQKPEKQAEILLTRAVSRSSGATDEIQSRVAGWRGKIQLNPQLSQLTTAALNSDDVNVRASAIEVQLAAYGLDETDATVNSLVSRANSSDRAQKIWALWALGLVGNRGVQTERVVQVLAARLHSSSRDSDEETRHWAVEGLALVGTTPTIALLLDVMHNDPSPLVRERAACSLAESGMLTHEQRLTAVPQLITYSDDPALDAQTHAWAFQALSDITKQRLPNDSGAWRNWYQNSAVSVQ
jgi:hypothetical protein